MKKYAFVLLFILYFLSVIHDSILIGVLLSLVACVVLGLSFQGARTITRTISGILILLSIVLGIVYGMEPASIILGVQQNIPILVLILLAPLIAVPLRLSGYLSSIESVLISQKEKPNRAYGGLLMILFMLSPVLNIGAVRLTHEVVKDIGFDISFLGKAYVSGYLSAVVWSPYFASVATVLFMMDVSFSSYVMVGLIFGILQIFISLLLFVSRQSGSEAHGAGLKQNEMHKQDWSNVQKIFLFIILLMGMLIITERFLPLEMISIITFSTVLIPLLWGVLSGKLGPTITDMKETVRTVSRASNETLMFLTAGLFASVMMQTDFNDLLTPYFMTIADMSALLLILAIILLTIGLTMIGLHQIIVVPLIMLQVSPEAVGFSPVTMAFVFILAWSLSVVTSPISLTNLLVSNILKTRWSIVAFRWNGPYVAVMLIIGVAIALLLRAFSFFS
ncbi:hypothetical protein J4760_06870 [Salinicoccus sp. ID82-1]|uniref:TRAP transporter large permease subunit n=1 Tax=Salinicoccus sp. ID82-1 TaxID=2820269 RepID=UPI001F1979F3|nr:TRAP transporter large permease subunit [Salinicoccus sp. ID82-1]MCG1009739.1 hypothetical protein [Salinicoccus sp. ID82-1]